MEPGMRHFLLIGFLMLGLAACESISDNPYKALDTPVAGR